MVVYCLLSTIFGGKNVYSPYVFHAFYSSGCKVAVVNIQKSESSSLVKDSQLFHEAMSLYILR
jgi:hypothetical protein